MLKHDDYFESFTHYKKLFEAIQTGSLEEVKAELQSCPDLNSVFFFHQNISVVFYTDEVEEGFLLHMLVEAGREDVFDYVSQLPGLDWTKRYTYTMRSITPGEEPRMVEHHSLSAAEYALCLGKYSRAAKLFERAIAAGVSAPVRLQNVLNFFALDPQPQQRASDALHQLVFRLLESPARNALLNQIPLAPSPQTQAAIFTLT